MFGLGTTELLIFMVVVLLVFGSARLPTLMRNLGKSATEFKKGMREDPMKPKRLKANRLAYHVQSRSHRNSLFRHHRADALRQTLARSSSQPGR